MLTYWHKVIQRPINRLTQAYKVYNTDIVIWNDRPINSSSLVIPTLIDKIIHGILVISAGTREGISHSFSQYMECRQIRQNCVVKASCYTESMKNKS